MTTASIFVNPNATPQNITEMNNYRAVLEANMKPCQSAIVVPAGKTGRHRFAVTAENGTLHVMAHEEDVSDLDMSKLETVSVDDVTIEGDGATTALSVKDDGINTAKIADSSVTTAKIADASVSIAKIEKVGSITGTLKEGNDSRTLRDIDGNVYRTVKIDGVEWMAENLRVTRYNDGTAIPQVQDSIDWAALTTGALCAYDNDPPNVALYGWLYNGFVVNPSNVKKIAPKGWRVPDSDTWIAMTLYLAANGYNWDGSLGFIPDDAKIGKALASNGGEWKENETEGWVGNAQNGNNSSGFTALPGGYRSNDGSFSGTAGKEGYASVANWWSTSRAVGVASSFYLGGGSAELSYGVLEDDYGASIRLVRGGRNTVGVGGASYPGTAVQTAGYDIVSVAAAASTNHYTLADGYDGQELTVVNIGDVDAYVGFALIGADEARRAIWLDGAWRAY